ncbi:MAG TPA: polyprenol monophosphomannose synthase [Acidimicrobiales bacterium]|nr:polyprenol monophosphomannose synthase [Acidimicrobiales bacterium]
MTEEQCLVSVVVPTRNEALNVAPLVGRLASALAAFEGRWEVVFVDDSDDSTPSRVTALQGRALPVELLHRLPGERKGGLGGAVCTGFEKARGEVIAVMDADLQHPPEVLPALIRPVLEGEVDLVAGSRYTASGTAGGLSGPWRHLVSTGLRRLVHLAIGRSRALDDPLSGLFAFRRSLLDDAALRPDGYKILLEVVVRCRPEKVANYGFHFAPRHAGNSKADLHEGLVFFRLVWRLARAERRPSRSLLTAGLGR